MFVLIIMAITAAGQIAMQNLTFNSEKHCHAAANKLNQASNKDIKVTAVCVDRGLAH